LSHAGGSLGEDDELLASIGPSIHPLQPTLVSHYRSLLPGPDRFGTGEKEARGGRLCHVAACTLCLAGAFGGGGGKAVDVASFLVLRGDVGLPGALLRRAVGERELEMDSEWMKRSALDCKAAIAFAQKQVDEVTEQVAQSEAVVAKLEADASDMAEEAAHLEHCPPADHARLRILSARRSENNSNLREQQAMLEKANDDLEGANRRLYGAHLEGKSLHEVDEGMSNTTRVFNSKHLETAKLRHQGEQKAINKYKKSQAEAQAARRRKDEEEQSKAEQQIASAKEGRKKCLERLQQQQRDIHSKLHAMESAQSGAMEARTAALLNLKESVDKARNVIAGRNTIRAKKDKKEQELQAMEASELLHNGINPYEVFRKRSEDARVEKAKKDSAQVRADRHMDVVKRIMREEAEDAKRREEVKKEKAFRTKFDAEMGTAKEKRIEKYMMEHTRDGVLALDPTGNLPWDPSKVTDVKTWAFGTGRARPEVVQLLQAKYKHELPNPLLINRDVLASMKAANEKPPEVSHSEAVTPGVSPGPGNAASPVEPPPAEGDDDDDDTEIVELPKKEPVVYDKLPIRKLTALEERYQTEALERQKVGMVQSQVVMRKEFKGDAFLAKPKVVLFKDFEVGQVYKKKVVLTNVSYTFNYFKVLDLDDSVKDFFTIEYIFPGRMSAGTTCSLTITFEPKVNEDIETVVPLLAQTGPIMLPLRCRVKRRVVSLHPTRHINFGAVTLGESGRGVLTLVNDGALPASFRVEPRQAPSEMFKHPDGGQIEGYSRLDLEFQFHPEAERVEAFDATLKFSTHDVKDISVHLEGVGGEVPVAVANEVVDLKCCIFDQTYRDQLIVYNRGKTALKCSIVKRKELMDAVEFTPDLLFCQAGTSASFYIKFKPIAGLFEKLGKYGDVATGMMEVPMRIQVPDQVLPVQFVLRAKVTTGKLAFEPDRLEFGRVPISESVGAKMTLVNRSLLSQKYGFVNLPKGVEVRPAHGFGTLLPGESVELTVIWSPSIVGPASFNLTCRTLLMNRTYTIPCTAFGFSPPLTFSSNLIELPATPIHDTSNASFVVSNTSKTRIQVDYTPRAPPDPEPVEPAEAIEGPPAEAPKADTEAEEEPRSNMGSRSSKKSDKSSKGDKAKGKDKDKSSRAGSAASKASLSASKGAESAGGEEEEEEEDELGLTPRKALSEMPQSFPIQSDQCLQNTVRVPCFIKGVENYALYVEVHTISVEAKVHLQEPVMELKKSKRKSLVVEMEPTKPARLPETGYYVLDFGKVPVGHHSIRNITLCNTSSDLTSYPKLSPMDHTGTFTVLHARRPLEPLTAKSLAIDFLPVVQSKYSTMMTLRSQAGQVRVKLCGEGISPNLELDPPLDLLDLGDTYMLDRIEKKMELVNNSPFELTFKARLEDCNRGNLDGTQPFGCHPMEGTIPAGERLDIVVTFNADHEPVFGITDQFTAMLRIVVPNQAEDLLLQLRARSWERGMYVIGCDLPMTEHVFDPFYVKTGKVVSSRRALNAPPEPAAPAEKGKKPPSRGGSKTPATPVPTQEGPPVMDLSLTFPQEVEVGETSEACVTFGALKSGKSSASGDMVISPLSAEAVAAGWSMGIKEKPEEPSEEGEAVTKGKPRKSTPGIQKKGLAQMSEKIAGGDNMAIEFAFAPAEGSTAALMSRFGIGEWQETTVQVQLKGGSIPEPRPLDKNAIGKGAVMVPVGSSITETHLNLKLRCFVKGSQFS
ncbi:hypothetical protein CYMTET_18711, partial [Cymbomonas tetramitiformis]